MNKNYKTLYNKVTKKDAFKFNDFASHNVDNYCTDMQGGRLIGEARSGIIFTQSVDMALGAEAVKNQYIVRGIVMGVGISLLVYGTCGLIKKFQKKEES